MDGIIVDDTINRVLRATARLHWPENSVECIENDAEKECRWWNGLGADERLAYVNGARLESDCAVNEWLEIGETHRQKILDAARAVQCWLAGGNPVAQLR